MKYSKIILFSLSMAIFLLGCSGQEDNSSRQDKSENPSSEAPKDKKAENGKAMATRTPDNRTEKTTGANTKASHSGLAKKSSPQEDYLKEDLMQFVPNGYQIMDFKAGDLNRDAHGDVVLICHRADEDNMDIYNVEEYAPRPLLLLLGEGSGKLKLAARNDKAVLCYHCGGVFGNPYDKIAIKNGYFSIEHYGGSNWRWTRIMTFKYVEKEADWHLHRDGGVSYHTGNPDEVEESVKTKKDFGRVRFENFDFEPGM